MVKRKGGGKKKVLHLSEFLGDEALAAPKAAPIFTNECSTDLSVPLTRAYDATPSVDVTSLPSAPRAQREGSFDPSKVPRNPPYTAYVGNLPFDTDDHNIVEMFSPKEVKEVRLLNDKDTGKFKGYGYVEFYTADGLIEALKKNETLMGGRQIKIDVATTAGNGGSNADRWDRGARQGDEEGGIRQPYEDLTSDDWRNDVKPDTPPPGDRRGPRDGPRNDRRDEEPDTFSRAEFGTGSRDGPPRSDRRGPRDEEPDTFSRAEFGTGARDAPPRSDRRGPRDEAPDTFSRAEFGTGCKEVPREPRSDRFGSDAPDRNAWGRGPPQMSEDREERPWGRGPSRESNDRDDRKWERGQTLESDDRDQRPWGRGTPRDSEDRTDRPWGRGSPRESDDREERPWGRGREAQSRDDPRDSPRDEPSEVPSGRRKLNLKPRAADGKSNPFGAAKPVATAERSAPEGREVEEKTKPNPFGAAKAVKTGPVLTAQKLPSLKKQDDGSDEIIIDSNKFLLLDEEEA